MFFHLVSKANYEVKSGHLHKTNICPISKKGIYYFLSFLILTVKFNIACNH